MAAVKAVSASDQLLEACKKSPLSDDIVEEVEALVEAGANVDDVDADSCSALHYLATGMKDVEPVLSLLLEYGADVNLKNKAGKTPLWMAASTGNLNLIRIMVNAGADPHAKADDGQSAADIATDHRFFEVANYIKAAPAAAQAAQ